MQSKYEVLLEYFTLKGQFKHLMEYLEQTERHGWPNNSKMTVEQIAHLNLKMAEMEDKNDWLPEVIEAIQNIIDKP
jgi:hypothetical protein